MAWLRRKLREVAEILLPALALAAIAFYLSGYLKHQQEQQNQQRIQQSLEAKANQLAQAIVEKMTIYQYGLRGVRGSVLSAGVDNFGYSNMLAYSQSRDLTAEFPGARGFGIIRKVAPADAAGFLQKAEAESPMPFLLRQHAPHSHDLLVIQYIEPLADNEEAVGFDIASEPARYQTALKAATENKAVLTEPVTLIQAQNKKSQGFLLLMPIYPPGALAEQPEQRYQQLFGFAYAPLLIDEILSSIHTADEGIQLEVVDRVAAPEQPFFVRSVAGSVLSELHAEAEFTLFSRNWQVRLVASQAFIDQLELQSPQRIFYSALSIGALVILIISSFQLALIRRLQLARHRAVLAAIVENAN